MQAHDNLNKSIIASIAAAAFFFTVLTITHHVEQRAIDAEVTFVTKAKDFQPEPTMTPHRVVLEVVIDLHAYGKDDAEDAAIRLVQTNMHGIATVRKTLTY